MKNGHRQSFSWPCFREDILLTSWLFQGGFPPSRMLFNWGKPQFQETCISDADLCQSLFKWHVWEVMNLAVMCKENTAADVTVVVLCCIYLWICLSSFTFKATLFRRAPLHWSATKVRVRWPTKDPEGMYSPLTNMFNIPFITKIISELHWYQTSLKTEVRIHASSWSRL